MKPLDKILFFILIVLSLKFFNFLPLGGYYNLLNPFLDILFVYIIYKVQQTKCFCTPGYFSKVIVLLCVSYCVSACCSIFIWNQSVFQSVYITLTQISILSVYFWLRHVNFDRNLLIKIFVVCTCIWTAIEWIQQITYPNVLFLGRNTDSVMDVEQRMGLWRFYLTGVHFAIFVLLIYLEKILTAKFNQSNWFVFLVALMGIVGYVSRKQIYVSLAICFLAFLFYNKKKNIISFLFIVIGAYFGFQYLMESMSDLNTKTVEELGSDDFIRTLATSFFIFDFSQSPLYHLFGTGMVHTDSPLGQMFAYYQENYHYYTVDCGIVGYFTHFGIVGTTLFLLLVVNVLKKWKSLLVWHKLYLIYNCIMFQMAFWGNSNLGLLSFVLFLYLVNNHLEENDGNESDAGTSTPIILNV